MVLTNLIYSSDLSVSAQAAVSGEQRYKMAASSTADLALDDIKKADEIISMAVLGKLHIFYGNIGCQVFKRGIQN